MPIPAYSSPAATRPAPQKSSIGLPLSYAGPAKRGVDLMLALVLAPIVAVLVGVLYLLVRRDGGPGFYGHIRVGRNGRSFLCWKLRSMVPDAAERLEEYLQSDSAARAEWNESRKLRHDPRVTPLGAFLRKTSLDELPQLWNVIRGEMSLIGPRPVTLDELEMYGAQAWAYLALRPGITGLWQVSGRNDVSYAERVQMDAEYQRSLSALRDLKILARTAVAVAQRTGC